MAPASCNLRENCPHCAVVAAAQSLGTLAECLKSDLVRMEVPQDMQGYIICASKNLEAAEEMSKDHLNTLTAQTKKLLDQKNRLENEEKEKKMKIDQLNITSASATNMMYEVKSMKNLAGNHLNELRGLLTKLKQKETCERVRRNIILGFLPIYTVIVSVDFFREALTLSQDNQAAILLITLVASFQASLYMIQKEVQELMASISHLEDKVFELEQEAYTYEQQKNEIQKKIDDDNNICKKISEDMKKEQDKLSQVNEKEEVVKNYQVLLTSLCETVNHMKNVFDYDDIWNRLKYVSCNMTRLEEEGATYFGCSAKKENNNQIKRLESIMDISADKP